LALSKDIRSGKYALISKKIIRFFEIRSQDTAGLRIISAIITDIQSSEISG
jgi:hypothetical protein